MVVQLVEELHVVKVDSDIGAEDIEQSQQDVIERTLRFNIGHQVVAGLAGKEQGA